MKWYFVELKLPTNADDLRLYPTNSLSRNFMLSEHFCNAAFVTTIADALGIKNSLHKDLQSSAAIWVIDVKKMKITKVKL